MKLQRVGAASFQALAPSIKCAIWHPDPVKQLIKDNEVLRGVLGLKADEPFIGGALIGHVKDSRYILPYARQKKMKDDPSIMVALDDQFVVSSGGCYIDSVKLECDILLWSHSKR